MSQLNAPKKITLIVALVIAIIAVVAYLVPSLPGACCAFWILLVGFIVLLAGNLFKGL
jgi:hypothetical protein